MVGFNISVEVRAEQIREDMSYKKLRFGLRALGLALTMSACYISGNKNRCNALEWPKTQAIT